METVGNCGLVKTQPTEFEETSVRNTNSGEGWVLMGEVRVQGPGIDGSENLPVGIQKVEVIETPEAETSQTDKEIEGTFFTEYRQPLSEDLSAKSDDEFVIMYSDDEETSGGRGDAEKKKRSSEKKHSSKSPASVSTPVKEASTKVEASGSLFDEDDPENDNGFTSLVAMVDNFINAADGGGDAQNKNVPTAQPSTQNGGSQTRTQQDLDEIQVVEEGAEDFQEGEVIKDFRHGTNSATFLSQMSFFGGKTWAKGRGRGRGRGRGCDKDVTNIALKLIESNEPGEAGIRADLVETNNKILEQGDNVTSGQTKKYKMKQSARADSKDKNTPISNRRRLRRGVNSKESESPPLVKGRGRGIAKRGRGSGILQKGRVTLQRGRNAPRGERMVLQGGGAMPRGGGRLRGGRGSRGQSAGRGKIQAPAAAANSATDAAGETEDDAYESNEEETLAAIKASLEELEKNKAKKSSHDSLKKDEIDTTQTRKGGESRKKSKEDMNKSRDRQKKRGRPAHSHRLSDKSEKVSISTSTLNKTRRGRPKKSPSVKNTANASQSSDESDQEAARTSVFSIKAKAKDGGRSSRLFGRSGFTSVRKSERSLKRDKEDSDEETPQPSTSVRTRNRNERFQKSDEDKGSAKEESPTRKRTRASKDTTPDKFGKGRGREQPSSERETVNFRESKKSPTPQISCFDSVTSISVSDNSERKASHASGERSKDTQSQKNKVAEKVIDIVDLSVETDSEKEDEPKKVTSSKMSSASLVRDNISSNYTPFVKLTKLNSMSEESSSRHSQGSASPAPGSKRQHDMSDTEQRAGPKVSKRSTSDQPSKSGHHSKSVTDMASALDSSKSKGKGESLTKSVGGMMSYLFGDKLAEECPSGFVVNVRLEVEKKNDADENNSTSSPAGCCKSKKPEMCPCLQRVSDKKLAAVLKERVEERRDLTVSAKASLLASILNFMQDLEATS